VKGTAVMEAVEDNNNSIERCIGALVLQGSGRGSDRESVVASAVENWGTGLLCMVDYPLDEFGR
jgi:hypothetical protein